MDEIIFNMLVEVVRCKRSSLRAKNKKGLISNIRLFYVYVLELCPYIDGSDCNKVGRSAIKLLTQAFIASSLESICIHHHNKQYALKPRIVCMEN